MHIKINTILEEIKDLKFNEENQICLQGTEESKDPYLGTGLFTSIKGSESNFTIPLFDLPYTNKIIQDLGLCRVRLMKLMPKTCYSWHHDQSKRIHIPLVTNEKCLMVVEDKAFHIPADGNYYLIDTTKKHTAINGDFKLERIHLIGCLKT